MAEIVKPNLLLSTETTNFDDETTSMITSLETSFFQMDFPLETEEIITEMIGKERQHSPRDDYLNRLRNGYLDSNVRNQALDWIWKVWFWFCSLFNSLCFLLLTQFQTKSIISETLIWKKTWLCFSCPWLLQACEELQFGPLCICLAVNYLDRFLSVHDLPVSQIN